MKNLKEKLKANQTNASKREKKLFKEDLGKLLLPEEAIKTLAPSQLPDENRLIKIP